MMDVLRTAQGLGLPDWMIGAGFLRNRVWDFLHGYQKTTPLNDIDLIYFDPVNCTREHDIVYENELKKLMDASWEVRNQARMHRVDNDQPRTSAADGLSRWVETPTCVAVRLNQDDTLELIAPWGIDDLVNLVVRPTPVTAEKRMDQYRARQAKKNWKTTWPKLKILHYP